MQKKNPELAPKRRPWQGLQKAMPQIKKPKDQRMAAGKRLYFLSVAFFGFLIRGI
ncbi:MAG TPA: hypothetical protein VGD78_00395 [Chthoniobacterales bacterium]